MKIHQTNTMRKSTAALTALVFLFVMGFQPDEKALSQKLQQIQWYGMQEAQKLASRGEKKVMIYAEASWCTYCKKMEKEVFTRQNVQNLISQYFYPVRLDIESNNIISFNGNEMTEEEFSTSMKVSGTPTFFFVDGKGKILGGQPGYLPPDVFKAILVYIGSDAYNKSNFDRFYKEEYQN